MSRTRRNASYCDGSHVLLLLFVVCYATTFTITTVDSFSTRVSMMKPKSSPLAVWSRSSSSSSSSLSLFPWRKKGTEETNVVNDDEATRTTNNNDFVKVDVVGNVDGGSLTSLETSSSSSLTTTAAAAAATTSLSSIHNEEEDELAGKRDLLQKGTALLGLIFVSSFVGHVPFLEDHADWTIIAIFVLGYVGIIFEQVFELNKAAVALLMSTGLWVTYADFFQNTNNGIATDRVLGQLGDQLAEVSDICFFLLAASAIVEVVDAHQGFNVVTNQIQTTSKKQLFWTIGFFTFFLSSILNNLTVTIVMCSLLRKLVPNVEERKLFGAMVVVAANAGGVWTPIGDVTTTMLWINHQLSTVPTILELFIPSLVCLVGSLFFLVNQVEEDDIVTSDNGGDGATSALTKTSPVTGQEVLVFGTGIASLLAVPVFAELTGLPPYLAMLTGLGVIWTLTDVLHYGKEEEEGLKVPPSLAKVDTSGILFFLGILMSIGVLDKSGLLKELAIFLSDNLPSLDIIATVIGLASAFIDNVPLVAATMGMYDLSEYGTDDRLWQLIALCAGTGGSILVIGSASGVALMGLEKVDFLWYFQKVSLGATIGYFAGIAAYLIQNAILNNLVVGGGGDNFLTAMLPQQVAVAADMIVQQGTAVSGLM